jgi:SH3-like domain-containing protein
MQRRSSQIMGFVFLLTGAGVAEAHMPGWQSPGWYIVDGTQSGIVIQDGSFPDAASCYSAINGRKQAARHHEFDTDICVKLAQDSGDDKPVLPSDLNRPASVSAVPDTAPGAPPLVPKTETPPKLALPRFASLAGEGVSVHAGPSQNEPVRWIYMRKGWPVEIIAEEGDWWEIRDYDGQTGWLEKKFLDGARTGILTGPTAQAIRAKPSRESVPLAWAEPDVLLKLRHCDAFWCEVEGPHVDGYVERTAMWGLLPSEILN